MHSVAMPRSIMSAVDWHTYMCKGVCSVREGCEAGRGSSGKAYARGDGHQGTSVDSKGLLPKHARMLGHEVHTKVCKVVTV